MTPSKSQHRTARRRRIRSKVQGTAARPRLSVYRSLKAMTAQLIDDAEGKTLVYATTLELKAGLTKEGAKKLGEAVAKKAQEKKISSVVFDRGGYKYHGRVKELADAARAGGLQF
ncbi:MAG: large subunit ribosomal protein [Candidatus Peribacteria bacterium]|nr:large subunit ribosomal protein [Candidatus Peribacteria bacterium]